MAKKRTSKKSASEKTSNARSQTPYALAKALAGAMGIKIIDTKAKLYDIDLIGVPARDEADRMLSYARAYNTWRKEKIGVIVRVEVGDPIDDESHWGWKLYERSDAS